MATEKKSNEVQKPGMNTTKKLTLIGLGLVIVGILATYFPWQPKEIPTSADIKAKETLAAAPTVQQELSYEELLEMRLESILAQLEGAGLTEVMVTVSAGQEKVLAEEVVECVQDTNEVTTNGTNKNTTRQDLEKKIVLQEGEIPFVVKENRPDIEGVLVLAEGADDTTLKNAIIQAVSSVLDVPVHKIAVYKMADQ